MDARLVKHHVDQLINALSDISGTVKFCEKRIWDASCDHTMKEETEDLLNGSARTLSLIARLIDWGLEEMEKLAMRAGREAAA